MMASPADRTEPREATPYCVKIADLARVHDMMGIVASCDRCAERQAVNEALMKWSARLSRELAFEETMRDDHA